MMKGVGKKFVLQTLSPEWCLPASLLIPFSIGATFLLLLLCECLQESILFTFHVTHLLYHLLPDAMLPQLPEPKRNRRTPAVWSDRLLQIFSSNPEAKLSFLFLPASFLPSLID